MSLPRYAQYKDSGVSALGPVPSHWDIFPLKRELAFLTSGSRGWAEHYADEGDLFIRITNLTRNSANLDLRDVKLVSVPEGAEGERTKVQPGDVLFSITAYIGSVAVVPSTIGKAFVSQHIALARLRSRRLLPEWVGYFAQSTLGQRMLEIAGYGGTKVQLSLDDVANLPIPTPPLEDQRTVIGFLDRETGKIDALIAEQEKLLTLLAEKRQATISHAVTRGLNPNASMKDSGVPWLGEVPAHWDVRRVSRSFKAKKGSNAAELTKEFCATIEGDHPVFSGQTENDGVMGFIDRYEFDAGEDGWVLSTTVGAKAMSVMHVKGRFSLSQNCMVILPRIGDIVTRFFFYHFQSLFSYERRMIPDHMQPSFRMEDLYGYKVGMPTADEQRAIASFLDGESAQLDNLKCEAERAIDLLKERRSALIAAAVSGKIDVRNAIAAASHAQIHEVMA